VDGERLARRGWLAVLLSTAGAVFLVGTPGPGRSWVGDGLVLLSIGVSVVWVLASKRLSRAHGALAATGWILLVGTAALAPVVLATEGVPPLSLPGPVWAAVAALALGSTVGAFVLWNLGLERMESGRAAVFLNLEPVVGAALGVALFGDAVGLGLAGGGALVMTGAALASVSTGAVGRRPRPADLGASATPRRAA
jgi:drug/metabolite transporter (DMT)-like permease